MKELGCTNVADALNNIPAFGIGVDGQGDIDAQTAGSNFIDFYNLGTQRTLVLVNGRRFISGNPAAGGGAGVQVDLNNIPLSMVERVEVVSVGGAPTYGSDAIAGIANIILKDDYEGFEIDTSFGISNENDLAERRFSVLTGGNFAKAKVMLCSQWNTAKKTVP